MHASGIYVIVYYIYIPYQVRHFISGNVSLVLKFNSGRLENYKTVVKLAVVGQ